jgi:transcriptional regulator with GAF, ATPase, and Fis domain
MMSLESLPAILQEIAEAEDDLAALTGVGQWTRRTSGADLVAFVALGEGHAIHVEGRRGESLGDDERRAARALEYPTTLVHADGVTALAPIRYAGVAVGAIVARGPADRELRLAEVAQTAAALAGPAMRARLDVLQAQANPAERVPELIGPSAAIQSVREAICRAAATPFAVLIEGESGTGKELVARAIHRLSARRERRFTAVNAAALTDELADTELFGHSRGAFTGAVAPRQGLFEEANGGSLFFDEVAELSPRAQAKLLRAIQEREVRRVGENATRVVDARLLSATNRPLSDLVARGHFRDDLVFRLAVVRLRLPALRDRPDDVAPLAIRAWQDIRRIAGTRAMLGHDALARLAAHAWPGNVRELQNVIARMSMVAPERGRVTSRHVELVLTDLDGGRRVPTESLQLARASVERQTVAAALARHGGRCAAAARELGLTRQGLGKAMRRLSITKHEREAGVA